MFTLVGVAIGLSAYTWDLSFNFGAFGVVFLGHIIAIWLFSLSILMVTVFAHGSLLPGNKWIGYSMLILPTIWLVARIIDDSLNTGQLTDHVLKVASILSIAIALPYVVYLFFYFTSPDILNLNRKWMTALAGIVIVIGIIGYGLGRHNYLIMSCENFEISGQDTPDNCRCAKKADDDSPAAKAASSE